MRIFVATLVLSALFPLPLGAQELPSEILYEPPAREGPEVEVLATDLRTVRSVAAHEGLWWYALGDELYSISSTTGPTLVAGGLPEGTRLLSTEAGLLGISSQAVVLLDGDSLVTVVTTEAALVGVTYANGELWAFEGPVLWRAVLGAHGNLGARVTVLENANEPVSLLVDDGGVFYGKGGEEPYYVYAVDVDNGTDMSLVRSRFWAAEMVRIDDTHIAVLGRSPSGGWVERLDLEEYRLDRLGYSPRGSSDLTLIGDTLYWRSPSAIFQIPAVGGGNPTPVTVNVQPVGFAYDGDQIGWIEGWRGELVRMALPSE